jgi:hypothetical protein
MRVRCVNRELTDEQRALLKAPSRFRPNHRLTVGKEYLVLGVVSIIDSPQYGNTALFEIVDDDRGFVLFPAVFFEVTDSRCSSFWRSAVQQGGTVTFRPEEFYREFFHDDLSEGDPVVRQVFQAVVAKLEAEFSAETSEPADAVTGHR